MDKCYLHAVFCDDIRREEGGKVSLMGIYASHILFDHFPARMSKLCVHFSFVVFSETPPEALKFELKKDDEIIHASELAELAFTLTDDPEPNVYRVSGGFELPPTEYTGPCMFSLTGEVDSKSVIGPKLKITTRDAFAAAGASLAV